MKNIDVLRNEAMHFSNLNSNQVSKLKIIGKGTDANVYRINKNLLLKLYKLPQSNIKSSNDEIIKTDKPQKFINTFKFQSRCYNEEGLRLGYKDLIEMANIKQEKINLTYLPLAPCYIDNSFRGCILKNCRPNIPIDFFKFLPERKKLIIIQKILMKFKELIANNIYPYDLYNKIDSDHQHNNIIIDFKLEPTIIDLDGKSTAYTESFNETYYYDSTFGISCLTLEFLFNQDMIDFFDEPFELKDYYQDFYKGKIDYEDVDKLINTNIEFEYIEEFINKRIKKNRY
ncbi:MAG: hypothetical protein E7158_03030 [Firmicutes bacterium]|nr:hypothetical protein [Bacillota bacterium]